MITAFALFSLLFLLTTIHQNCQIIYDLIPLILVNRWIQIQILLLYLFPHNLLCGIGNYGRYSPKSVATNYLCIQQFWFQKRINAVLFWISFSLSPLRESIFFWIPILTNHDSHSFSQFLNEIFSLFFCFLTTIYTSVVFRNRFPSVHDRFISYQGTAIHHNYSYGSASLHLFAVLARFWIFVMFDKSFRISQDFIKEQVRQETQTFHDGADNGDTTMKCEFSYPSYSQSDDNAQNFREEIDGQHEYEGVVVREDKELQYDMSTGIASCATIMRQKVSMKRQAPPVLWTKYNDDDLWPEDQRIQEDEDRLSKMAMPSNLNLINYTFVSYVIHEQIRSESTIY